MKVSFTLILHVFVIAWLSSPTYALDHSDEEIASNIQSKLTANHVTSDLGIKVISNNGVVTLVGEVDTDQEASQVIEIAASIPGVKNTDALNLTVKKGHLSFTDLAISAKIKGSFIREKLFGDKDTSKMPIAIETKDGIVHLTGTVETPQEAEKAFKIAKSVSDVKAVDSKIRIVPKATNEEGAEW